MTNKPEHETDFRHTRTYFTGMTDLHARCRAENERLRANNFDSGVSVNALMAENERLTRELNEAKAEIERLLYENTVPVDVYERLADAEQRLAAQDAVIEAAKDLFAGQYIVQRSCGSEVLRVVTFKTDAIDALRNAVQAHTDALAQGEGE